MDSAKQAQKWKKKKKKKKIYGSKEITGPQTGIRGREK